MNDKAAEIKGGDSQPNSPREQDINLDKETDLLIESEFCNPVILVPQVSENSGKEEYFSIDEENETIIEIEKPLRVANTEVVAAFVATGEGQQEQKEAEKVIPQNNTSCIAEEENNHAFLSNCSLAEIEYISESLENLGNMLDKGYITNEEMNLKKKEILRNSGLKTSIHTGYKQQEQSVAQDRYLQSAQTAQPQYQASVQANQKYAVSPVDDVPTGGMKFLCFLIPLVGLILFLTEKDTKPISAKAYGKMALISVCIGVALYIILMAIGISALNFL